MANIDFNNLPYAVESLLNEVRDIKATVSRIESNQPVEDVEQLTVDKAVKFIQKAGYPISKSRLYKLTSSKCIPHRHFGSKLIFNKGELINWCESQD
jgi:hypothetical protein